MSHTIKIQSITDIITNSSSETFLVNPREGQEITGERIKKSIIEHAIEHRCPYESWWIEEHKNDKSLRFYNKSNHGDVSGELEMMSLFDLYLMYVWFARTHGNTPSLSNRTNKTWRHITVDEVFDSIKEDIEYQQIYQEFTKDSVLVHIDHDLDKTSKAMFDHYNVEDVSGKFPFWIDFLDKSLFDYNLKRYRGTGEDDRFEETYDYCKKKFNQWEIDNTILC